MAQSMIVFSTLCDQNMNDNVNYHDNYIDDLPGIDAYLNEVSSVNIAVHVS